MRDLPFLEEGGLEAFLEGLEATLAELGWALDAQPPQVLAAVAPLTAQIAEGFDECRHLAQEALWGAGLRALLAAHARLERDLLALHAACWQARGPSPVAWINRAVSAVHEYLAGQPQAASLSRDLDARVAWLDAHDSPEALAILDSLRPLSDWARGAVPASLEELHNHLDGLVRAAQQGAAWLERPRGLAALLAGEEEPRHELARLRGRLPELAELLEALEDRPSHELGEELRARLADWGAAQPEEVACPACACLSPAPSRRCRFCSSLLPGLDLGPALDEPAEQENFVRLREACQAFRDGQSSRDVLFDLLEELQAGLHVARQAVSVPEGPAYHRALDQIQEALTALSQVEVGSDVSLLVGLERFQEGARSLKRAQAQGS